MRIIIRGIKEREEFIDYLKKHLPNAEWCYDEKKNAMDPFLRAMKMAGDDPCIFMEEDIIITKDFYKKALKVIAQKPFSLIQFFSMRKDDIRIGSRWDNNYMMNQCHYHPPTYSKQILEFYNIWGEKNKHPHGCDTMMQKWLKLRKEKYWISVPSLVQHRIAKSMIDPRRSSKRQSLTFEDGIE